MFSRVLAHYSFPSVQAVLALPARTFWMLYRNIDRHRADEGIQLLNIALAGQGGEGATQMMEQLRATVGKVVVIDEAKKALAEMHERDRAGLLALKGLGKAMI